MILHPNRACPEHPAAAFCMHEGTCCAAAYGLANGSYEIALSSGEVQLQSSQILTEEEARSRMTNWVQSLTDERDEAALLVDEGASYGRR